MLIHEYQGKALLAKKSIAIPRGALAATADEAEEAARALGGKEWMVKAQIHAGGRGLAGGIQSAQSVKEVKEKANQLLGTSLATKQTAARALPVNSVYIEERLPLKDSMYLCMMLDASASALTLLAARAGGVHIEEAEQSMLQLPCPPPAGIQPVHARLVAHCYGLPQHSASLLPLLQKLYDLCRDEDLLQCEINPLALTDKDEWVVLDCKITCDDNAAFRHPHWASWEDETQSAAIDVAARQLHLRYIGLEGSIGCMVNGAGLAMATMDALVQNNLQPANFLDIGGDADVQRVHDALKLMIESAGVQKIFINVFGGIVHCDIIARGLVKASEQLDIAVPMVVRLAGAKSDAARAILEASSLNIIAARSLKDALQAIAAA